MYDFAAFVSGSVSGSVPAHSPEVRKSKWSVRKYINGENPQCDDGASQHTMNVVEKVAAAGFFPFSVDQSSAAGQFPEVHSMRLSSDDHSSTAGQFPTVKSKRSSSDDHSSTAWKFPRHNSKKSSSDGHSSAARKFARHHSKKSSSDGHSSTARKFARHNSKKSSNDGGSSTGSQSVGGQSLVSSMFAGNPDGAKIITQRVQNMKLDAVNCWQSAQAEIVTPQTATASGPDITAFVQMVDPAHAVDAALTLRGDCKCECKRRCSTYIDMQALMYDFLSTEEEINDQMEGLPDEEKFSSAHQKQWELCQEELDLVLGDLIRKLRGSIFSAPAAIFQSKDCHLYSIMSSFSGSDA